MSRVNDLQIAARDTGRHQHIHCPLPRRSWVFLAVLDEQRVEVAEAFVWNARVAPVATNGLVQLEDPIGQRENQFHEPADGHPARKLAAGVASHTIGDDHSVADFLCPLRVLPRVAMFVSIVSR